MLKYLNWDLEMVGGFVYKNMPLKIILTCVLSFNFELIWNQFTKNISDFYK